MTEQLRNLLIPPPSKDRTRAVLSGMVLVSQMLITFWVLKWGTPSQRESHDVLVVLITNIVGLSAIVFGYWFVQSHKPQTKPDDPAEPEDK